MDDTRASGEYRVGTASWTDPTLLQSGFYPATIRTADARLRFYAEHFDTVEVDSTYYALPSERNAALWVERTPPAFHFNIKAFACLTQHAAETRALPEPIRTLLSAEERRAPRLSRPTPAVRALCFEMFSSALAPLRQAGKLGCVLFQFPPWFVAGEANEAYLDECRARLSGDRLAVEFRHTSWFGPRTRRTLDFLAARGLPLVCVDAPAAPSIAHPPYACTSDVAYVRLHGRNREAWFQRRGTAAERFKYLYSDAELRECAERLQTLGAGRAVYVMFNNCYSDYGVRNAVTMRSLLAA